MRDRDLDTRELVQLIDRLRALIRGIDTTARRDLDFELNSAREWYERGDPVRAGLALAAAGEIDEAIADLPEARELLEFLLHETGWPRTLRIQYLSDLHVRQPDQLAIADASADVLVVAGDVANTWEGLRWIIEAASAPHVVFVAGNHDPLGEDCHEYRRKIRLIEAEDPARIHVLENDVLELGGLVIMGCTLWSDFRLAQISVDRALRQADDFMIEYQRVVDHAAWHGPRPVKTGQTCRPPPLSAATTRGWHLASRDWLDRTLRAYAGWNRVVVTHHAPHPNSVTVREGDRPHSWSDLAFDHWAPGAYASDCSELLAHADVWIHGHTHRVEDYAVGGCRVLSNPARDEAAYDPVRCIELAA
ncbi:metallophosphoesterase [Halofilum ochraceum]|uniref:metallophosphoesterase n=1 Tax=Halofilum ochraceum TaxID=1611323 RepID=UPI0008DA20D8|nr:metallophosphoesterase [Halofilum ochraceum]